MVKNNLQQTLSWETSLNQHHHHQQQQQQQTNYVPPNNQKEIYPWMNDKNKTNKKNSSSTGKNRWISIDCLIGIFT